MDLGLIETKCQPLTGWLFLKFTFNQKRVPFPWLDSKLSSPPMALVIHLLIANPRPNPSYSRLKDPSPCAKGIKILSRQSSGIPGPESSTSKRIVLYSELDFSNSVRNVTFPPCLENLRELFKRF